MEARTKSEHSCPCGREGKIHGSMSMSVECLMKEQLTRWCADCFVRAPTGDLASTSAVYPVRSILNLYVEHAAAGDWRKRRCFASLRWRRESGRSRSRVLSKRRILITRPCAC